MRQNQYKVFLFVFLGRLIMILLFQDMSTLTFTTESQIIETEWIASQNFFSFYISFMELYFYLGKIVIK